jgi:L-lactate dehydrogenase complex protein LldG
METVTPMDPKDLPDVFARNLSAVSAVVHRVATLDEALSYAAALCDPEETPPPDPDRRLPQAGGDGSGEKARGKVLAAPGLEEPLFQRLAALCTERGIRPVSRDLRRIGAGIDVGLTLADLGIAETGTLVIDSASEDLRLATMLSDIHVAVLPLSRLRATATDAAAELTRVMKRPPASYLAFITGASRTADIERILALGVHGPLALHTLLWEDR